MRFISALAVLLIGKHDVKVHWWGFARPNVELHPFEPGAHSKRLRGAMVARRTPVPKAACSSHVGVKILFSESNARQNQSVFKCEAQIQGIQVAKRILHFLLRWNREKRTCRILMRVYSVSGSCDTLTTEFDLVSRVMPSGTATPSFCNLFSASLSDLKADSGILPPLCGRTCSRKICRFVWNQFFFYYSYLMVSHHWTVKHTHKIWKFLKWW